jgi:hypothetical protein
MQLVPEVGELLLNPERGVHGITRAVAGLAGCVTHVGGGGSSLQGLCILCIFGTELKLLLFCFKVH